ncbi:MAG: DUF362 domain-containing protein [Spirochaetes bacterium]|nr:DUF362 domain-containing protein [Spirochaetota bacterium]
MKEYFSALSKHGAGVQSRSSRKDFLRAIAAFIGSIPLISGIVLPYRALAAEKLKPRPRRQVKTLYDLAVVSGDSPAAMVRKAVETLGGIDRFVHSGDIVVVKPNIGWDREPKYAANTNPELLAALIRLCYAAGAKKVKVFDNTCNAAVMCYANSGIAEAVKKAGGHISHINKNKFMAGSFPEGSPMKSWPIYRDAVECDCFINVPIAKHHGLARLTLSMKNLMGVCGGNRGEIHRNIDEKLADLTGFINPDLTVIDAYRILLRNGPSGGNLKDVKLAKTVIAGTDPVLADAYAATLFDIDPQDIGYIKIGEEKKLGTLDIAKAAIKKLTV